MKFLTTCKDGGPESAVWAHVLIELKSLFSIMLLRFEDGSRDAYHSHAFHAISWVLRGELCELQRTESDKYHTYTVRIDKFVHRPSWRPVITHRSTTHKVISRGCTWVLTFRGPWARTWTEIVPGRTALVVLENGRVEVQGAVSQP